MATLIIGNTYAEVEWKGKSNLYRTDLLFGDVIEILEKHYPKMLENREYWHNYMNDDLFNHNSFKINFKLWGMSEGYSALSNMYDFLQYNDGVKLSLKDVEELRLEYQFESYQCYNADNDENFISLNKKSYIFKNLKTITQVLCAVLYYYALNDYRLRKCALCGKWFATQTLKERYCKRKSNIEKYSHLTCVEAKQRIRKNNGVNNPLKKRFNVLSSTLDRLINEHGLDKQVKKDFLHTAKEIREKNTEEEYAQWLFEQELKYKTRTQKAYQNNKNKEGANNASIQK